MSASALLIGASVASLNLCTDEYLLLLARPPEIASVSFLSQDPLESPLWRSARRYPANRGSIEDVLTRRPDIVLTMGGGGRATRLLARRLHIRPVELVSAASLRDVAANLRTVAAALGDPRRAAPWLEKLARLQRTTPRSAKDAMWLSGGGQTLTPGSIGTQWLRLAGLEQRAAARRTRQPGDIAGATARGAGPEPVPKRAGLERDALARPSDRSPSQFAAADRRWAPLDVHGAADDRRDRAACG